MTPRLDRVNRAVLGVLGVLLLLCGAAVLLVGAGTFGRRSADAPLVSDVTERVTTGIAGWFWPVLAVVGLLVAVLAGWWALAQPKVPPTGRLVLERAPEGSTEVASTALASALQTECETIPGVARARARVTTDDRVTHVSLHLSVGVPYDLASVVARVDDTVLPRLGQALDQGTPWPVRTTLRLDATSAPVSRLS